ncbi:MAG TPA: hypothetical protein VFW00_09915, partial [Rhodocyclaceae bacterium]|nr:hypothetical protein [Rhodocyclaceae bacterium]
MKSHLFALMAFLPLSLAMPAHAAMDKLIVSPTVGDAPGLVAPPYMQNACDWRGSLVRSVISNAPGLVTVSQDAEKRDAGRVLALQVTLLNAPPPGDYRKRRLGIQAKVYSDGKWLAVKNFEDRSMASTAYTVCDSIANLANNLGSDIADWIKDSDSLVCDSACTGLHPNEPIALGKELLAAPGVIDDEIAACKWTSQMTKDFVDDAKDADPPLPVKLFVTDEDILQFRGRKLVLRVTEIDLRDKDGTGKWLRMSGELIDGGFVAGSFNGYQKTRLGLFGTCKTLTSLGENMYQSIENWLREPTTKAELR